MPPSLPPFLQDQSEEAVVKGEGTVVQREGEGSVVEKSEPPRAQDEGEGVSEVLIRVRTATMTSADSSSLHTLTDRSGDVAAEHVDVAREQRFSPNPAGAASASSSSHVRHTTCGSVESEGFHSVTSEEGNVEDLLQQDFSQWSKEVSNGGWGKGEGW